MMSNQSNAAKNYRSAIERELADRLAQGARPAVAPQTAVPRPAPATASRVAPGIALLCLNCRGTSAGDAQFCTSCGERFNALVIAPRP